MVAYNIMWVVSICFSSILYWERFPCQKKITVHTHCRFWVYFGLIQSEWVTAWQMSWKSLSVFCLSIFLFRKGYIISPPNCPPTLPRTPPPFCLTNTILSILLTTPPLAVNQYVVAQTHTFQTRTLSFRSKLGREVRVRVYVDFSCVCVFAGCVQLSL